MKENEMAGFKAKLAEGPPLLGMWQALATPYTAEICARAGFDWLLIDGEHAPNTLQTLLSQLQAVAPFAVEPIARVPSADPVALKQYLDIGYRTILVPMVDSAEQAKAVVLATRFPPHGTRGVASATSRASGFGADRDYLANAHLQTTVIAQIESEAAVEAAESIAGVDGIDALFIGPGDLAASLGHPGKSAHPDVQQAIARAKAAIDRVGKPVGIFGLSSEDARARIAQGYRFVSIGTDIGLFARALSQELAAVR